MTLDEAIKHAEEVAEKNERRAESVRNRPISSTDFYHEEESCSKCAEEHRLLAEWLKDYKRLLEQEPCENVPDINDGNIYECSCGYGWNKSKVVRHHFCPNCGRAVDNSIRTELEPCEDCVSRQAALGCCRNEWEEEVEERLRALPPVTPQPKMGRWIAWKEAGNEIPSETRFECSVCHDVAQTLCNGLDLLSPYCPNCGAKMQEVEG